MCKDFYTAYVLKRWHIDELKILLKTPLTVPIQTLFWESLLKKKNHAWAASMQREAWEMLYNVIMTNVSVNFNSHKELYKIQLIGDDRCLLHVLTAGEAS